MNVIIEHEKNRERTYYIADEYYIRPVPIILHSLCACIFDIEILKEYEKSVDDLSFSLFLAYVKNENANISKDMNNSNAIRNKNGEIDGVVSMHTPNPPPQVLQAPSRDKRLFFKTI